MKRTLQLFSTIVMSGLFALGAQAAEEQWITLIDGSTGMDNFEIVGEANWSAADGAIQATEGPGTSFLLTKESYSNFVLRIEFWVSDDANSGIYMRCQDPAAITDRSCYEANIYDQRPDLSFGTGGIVHVGPVAEPYPKAGGKWNTYEITLNDEHLMVSLNGEQTVHITDTQFAAGPIGLQWARGTVRFRSMQIMPL
tara:strand:+ start:14383 stop:14973 length:591 start_codon:yes stop_codon:yes gene_type:complete